jgi:hypothetical protein
MLLHIQLSQQSVVHNELGIEANVSNGGIETMLSRLVMSRLIVGDETAQAGNNDTVILQQQEFDVMS